MAYHRVWTIIWTSLLFWFTTAIGIDPTNILTTSTIDLLSALGLHNNSWIGVTLTPGPQQLRPAYYLQGDYRDLKLPPIAFEQVTNLIRHNTEFTISTWLRQDTGNIGSILSYGENFNRYFELQSSGRKNEIRLHYTSSIDDKIYVETFHYKLDDNLWHLLILTISGSEIEFIIDCHSLYKRFLKYGPPQRNFTNKQQQIWIGQRNKHYLFKGALQDVRLIAGTHGYLTICPNLDSTCPTCGQFSIIETTVKELTKHLQEISERLLQAETRLTHIEECDCQKSCYTNNTIHPDGATWQMGCDLCACVHGHIQCRPVECPELPCKHPVNITGECCQSCLRHCLFYGAFYDHGELVTIKKCVECECQDGSMQCKRIDPETMCPKLKCPPNEQFSVADNCCKFCPGVDYCANGHNCHDNATCLNLETKYACQCNRGYQGDGQNCTDINECLEEGGLNGHHCNQNTICINTPGSYICECHSGYKRLDKFNCIELNECHTNLHNCHPTADCINTQGSYHCVCKNGYMGDGYHCEPICNQTCLNGGLCKLPNKCACPNGYTGDHCERDLDECKTNAHRCTNTSECVNMIGWYYCKCKDGYHSPNTDNNLGTLCQDINECENNLHTCHPTAECENLQGNYKCSCSTTTTTNNSICKMNCYYNNQDIENGTKIIEKNDPCHICHCINGIIQCEKFQCNCNTTTTTIINNCCPECDIRLSCKHQELNDIILMHGEQWTYQCQTCECLYGEIDCWDMICPPLLCQNPIKSTTDCCPHCDDPCLTTTTTNLTTTTTIWDGQPCTFSGHLYDTGAQFSDPSDPCVACNCKVPFCAELDGVLCCSYNYHCGNDTTTFPIDYDGLYIVNTTTTTTTTNNNNKQFISETNDKFHQNFHKKDSVDNSDSNK